MTGRTCSKLISAGLKYPLTGCQFSGDLLFHYTTTKTPQNDRTRESGKHEELGNTKYVTVMLGWLIKNIKILNYL